MPVYDESDLEDWVHDDGPLVLIGDAAHPMPVRPTFSFVPVRFVFINTLINLAWFYPRHMYGN